MGTETVRISAGTKRFGATTALRDIDLTIEGGEFLAVLGRSGSGKSTLLRVLAGLDTLSTGEIAWSGAEGRPRTGVVFQQPLLMPWLTVTENVCFARRFGAHRHAFDDKHVAQLMQRFGIDSLAARYPDQLSGGQAQRVAILRAVATNPVLLLLDEPFSALDPATKNDLQRWLADLAAALTITVVLVTHDVDEALGLADRVVLLGSDSALHGQWQIVGAPTADDTVELRRVILDHYHQTAGSLR
ncbi:ABC transporter ATP-binding protein [Mycolicibacterium helvum]|uniref:Nitrate ABC transporter ATP-binding protein n=1 Tax=Mycolicibacterium helvum TaxID=1534349 RepID=A0A7I7TD91_9MYCO|nr:ABC transporter ATP-binding protein [Mycolicibacterium helvum]BBY66419.1 nitrate ABC transporter ATP-binding protein [Mycolicibacterium helvum]